ncbi:MAG: biotin attachment protein [Planctomycetes bacterium]|nr:biotin attachment protein [Planctomycetota bacterium]
MTAPAHPPRERLVVPDLGLGGVPLVLSLWLIPEGTRVEEGDRVAELLAGGVTVDLEAPVAGRLAVRLVDEDDPLSPGTCIAEIEVTDGRR